MAFVGDFLEFKMGKLFEITLMNCKLVLKVFRPKYNEIWRNVIIKPRIEHTE